MCKMAEEIVENDNFIQEFVTPEVLKLSRSCYGKYASGDIAKGVAYEAYSDYSKMVGILESSSVNLKLFGYDNKTKEYKTFLSYEKIDEEFLKWREFLKNDFSPEDNLSPDSAIEDINMIIKCEKNEIRLNAKDCKKEPISTKRDDESYKVGEDYCIVPDLWSFTTLNRYKGTCAEEAITIYPKLLNFIEKYRELNTNYKDKIKSELGEIIPKVESEMKILGIMRKTPKK